MQKKTKNKDSKVKVTFTTPGIDGCGCLYLVGRFKEGSQSVYRMQHSPEGMWMLTLELEAGCEFQYRFRANDGTWLNDSPAPDSPDLFESEFSFVSKSDMILRN